MSSVEVRHDLSLNFRRVAGEYMDAVAYAQVDPLDDIAGLWEIIAINRDVRKLAAEQGRVRN